jgi:putative membrane protein
MKKRCSTSLLNNKLCAITCSCLFFFNIENSWAQQPQIDYHGSHMMWNGGCYGMFFGPFLLIIFIGLLTAVVVLVVRWLGGTTVGHSPYTSPMRDPLDILKERFARGEIEKEEYEKRCCVLRNGAL